MDIEYLKKVKKEKKLTLDEISAKSGIAKRTIEDIFRGRTENPRIDTMRAIENALGLNEKTPPGRELTDDEKELFELITQLTEDEIDELSNFVDFIISKRK